MEFKTKARGIGPLEVHVTEMDVWDAQDLGLVLMQEGLDTVGGLGAFFSDGIEGFVKSQQSVGDFVAGVVAGLKKLTGEKLRKLQMQIFRTTQVIVEGRIQTLDSVANVREVFGPRLGLLWEAIAFALETIFEDFIESLRSWASAAMTKLKTLEAKVEKLKVAEVTKASPSASRPS